MCYHYASMFQLLDKMKEYKELYEQLFELELINSFISPNGVINKNIKEREVSL